MAKKILEVTVPKKTIKALNLFFENEPKDKPYIRLATLEFNQKSLIRIIERNENKIFVNLDNEYFFINLKTKDVKGYGSVFESKVDSNFVKKLMN